MRVKPPRAQSYVDRDTRNRQRWRILFQLGLRTTETTAIFTSPMRFYAKLVELGADPHQYPELIQHRTGGRPFRSGSVPNRERYHELRKLGATADFATRWSRCETSFETGKRKLALGIGRRKEAQ